MNTVDSGEIAADLLTACLADVEVLVSHGGRLPADHEPSELADRMVAALDPDAARQVLGQVVAIAAVLLTAASQHTGHTPESILLAARHALAGS